MISWPSSRYALRALTVAVAAMLCLAFVAVYEHKQYALLPTFEVIEGMEAVGALPKTAPPRGLLFVAHGCSHAGTHWFRAGPACKSCPARSRRQRSERSRRALAL